MAGKVLNKGVYDFHKPVDHVKGEPGCYAFPVLFLDLIEIYIKNQSKKGYQIPLKRLAAP